MSKINALCVYCGSSAGTDPAFVEAARDFGKILAENRIRLIYGGGSVGLMGALADIRHRAWRRGHRHHPGVSDQQGTAAAAGARTDRHPRHARAQADHVRTRRRLRRLARRHRHAGGAGRADDLGAARPAQEADPDRQYQRLLGAAVGADRRICAGCNSCRRRCASTSSSPSTSRTFCRCCKTRAQASPRRKDDGGPMSGSPADRLL